MKKTRRRYDRAFKISVVAELESGKPLLRSPANMASIRVFLADGRQSWPKIPKKRLAVMETSTRNTAKYCRTGEAARPSSCRDRQAFKKSLRHDPKEGSGGENKTDAEGRFMTIQENPSDGLSLSISQSCQALEVSRSGYYKWRIQPEMVPFLRIW